MKYLLGLSYGHHESAACLLSEDGNWSYAREEWYSRIKHDHRYPYRAIEELIKSSGDHEVEIFAACLHEKPIRTWLGTGFKKGLSIANYTNKVRQLKQSNFSLHARLKRDWGISPDRVFFSSHHLSHHLTGMMLSEHTYDNGLVLDGYGEGHSGAGFQGQGAEVYAINLMPVHASVGLMYSAITEWCGYTPASDEFKVMALSAYAKPVHVNWVRQYLLKSDDSEFTINPEYFNFEDSGKPSFTAEFVSRFGHPVDQSVFEDLNSQEAQRACEVVASFQSALEDAVSEYVRAFDAKALGGERALLLSGGVFSNTRLVSHLMHLRRDSLTYVSASPGDGGSAIGAAYYGAQVLGWEMIPKASAFVGPQLKSMSAYPHLFRPIGDESTINEWIDQYLSQGNVLPFFQGIAEIGPRSLGVRSLICRIDQPAWIHNLNQVVKHREKFRPIAPIMLADDPAIVHLELTPSEAIACRHMGTLVKTPINFTRQLPQVENVMHADRSIRLQLLSAQDIADSCLHKSIPNLLKKYRVLANTSFNISGDPTVGTPLDCYINLRRMNLKYVAADNIVYQLE